MNTNDIKLWSNISFKTKCYRKNFDLVTENENIITECAGSISELKISEGKTPFIIGEYSFSVWNIELSKMLNIDINKIIRKYSIENTYLELASIIEDELIDTSKYKKIVLVHSLILRPEFRKHGITEEFIEFLYRDYYNENTLILALVKPFQDNPIDNDYYSNQKLVRSPIKIGDAEVQETIPASVYYSLKDLYDKNDIEFNEYKLFAVASKCGFTRIGETHLFDFLPENTIKRLKEKNNVQK